MNRTLTSTFLAALFLSSCSSLSRQPGDDDAMMAKLTPSQRSSIDEARATHSQRTDELAVARQDVVRAKAQKELAETDLQLAKVRVERAETVVAIAETNSNEELDGARQELEQARAKVLHQEELLRWRKLNVTRAERSEDLAECSQSLAAARTDLEKARAFSQTDQAAGRNIDIHRYETAVNEHKTRESVALAELEGVERQCELAERNYNEAVEAKSRNEPLE